MLSLKHGKIKSTKRGFTLIEVIVAAAMFGIMIVAVFPAFSLARSITTKANNIVDATAAASEGVYADVDDADDRSISYNGGAGWLTDPNTENEASSIGYVENTLGGQTVRYYFYIPYHPYRCGNDCEKCNKKKSDVEDDLWK